MRIFIVKVIRSEMCPIKILELFNQLPCKTIFIFICQTANHFEEFLAPIFLGHLSVFSKNTKASTNFIFSVLGRGDPY